MRGSQQRLVEDDELGRRGPPARGPTPMRRERGNQERVFQQVQVVRDRLQRSALLELSLQLLERDDLGRRGDSDPEDLPQQRRPPHRSQRQQVSPNGGLDAVESFPSSIPAEGELTRVSVRVATFG